MYFQVDRFNDQLRHNLIALSGSSYFHITRTLLFGIANTILIYELVLLQHDKELTLEDMFPCTDIIINNLVNIADFLNLH